MKASLRELLDRSPSGGGPFDDPETGRVGPDWSVQAKEPRVGSAFGKLHVRETLRNGQVRFHGRTETRAPAYHLLVDHGPSLSHALDEEALEEFLDFNKAWKGHHGLRGSVMVNRGQGWGEALWLTWLEGLEREPPGAVFVLSDFHGPLPEGAFWRTLTSRFWPRVIRFQHPTPNLGEKGEFLDCVSRRRHLFDPGAFAEAYEMWDKGLEAFFRKAGIDRVPVEDPSALELARALVSLS